MLFGTSLFLVTVGDLLFICFASCSSNSSKLQTTKIALWKKKKAKSRRNYDWHILASFSRFTFFCFFCGSLGDLRIARQIWLKRDKTTIHFHFFHLSTSKSLGSGLAEFHFNFFDLFFCLLQQTSAFYFNDSVNENNHNAEKNTKEKNKKQRLARPIYVQYDRVTHGTGQIGAPTCTDTGQTSEQTTKNRILINLYSK